MSGSTSPSLYPRSKIVFFIWVLLLLISRTGQAGLFDHSVYDRILHNYVDREGYVDYQGLRDNSQTALQTYLDAMAVADMGGWTKDERVAFWINAYNARVLSIILEHPELKKISDNFELFNRAYRVAGLPLSANEIKHRVLFSEKNPDNQQGPIKGVTVMPVDGRWYFALVGGAVDSPPLRASAYTPENLDRALSDNARVFINDPHHDQMLNGRLHLSQVWKWAAHALEPLGGAASFLSAHIDADRRLDAAALQVSLADQWATAIYDPFDWTVNDVRHRSSGLPKSSEDNSSEPSAVTPPSSPLDTNASEPPPAPLHPAPTDLNLH